MPEGVPEWGWGRERNPHVPVLRGHERRLRRFAPVAFQAQGRKGNLSPADPSQKSAREGSFSLIFVEAESFSTSLCKGEELSCSPGQRFVSEQSPLQGLISLRSQTLPGRIFRHQNVVFGIFQPGLKAETHLLLALAKHG